uniref:Dynein light chain Tctex-type 3 n=1 Tax=Oncorhynchus mykiss TaxID=8022 RepID=A0A8K9V8H0_ONCMY
MLDCVVFLADCLVSVSQCIEAIIGGLDYNQNKVNQWTASIVEHSLTQLVKQGRPFKFIVNCAIMQKSGAGLHTANSCYWDTATDGERDETPTHTVLTFEQAFAFVVLMNSVLRFGLFRRVQQSIARPIWTFLTLYRYRR